MTLSIRECGEAWREAVRLTSESFGSQWKCAPTALEVYGGSGTQELAEALDGSVDTVHNLAKAQRLYLYLYDWDAQKAILARAIHSYVRFAQVWAKHSRYELSPADCLAYLNNGLSGDALDAQIENDNNPAPEWMRRLENVKSLKWLERIASEPALEQSPKITRAAKLLKGRIEAENDN